MSNAAQFTCVVQFWAPDGIPTDSTPAWITCESAIRWATSIHTAGLGFLANQIQIRDQDKLPAHRWRALIWEGAHTAGPEGHGPVIPERIPGWDPTDPDMGAHATVALGIGEDGEMLMDAPTPPAAVKEER